MLTLLFGGLAWAGACCVGATTPAPTRLGPCEKVVAGVTVDTEASALRWDRQGRVRKSSLTESSASAILGLGVGLSRRVQLGATLPVRHTWRSTPALDGSGGGLGDASFLGYYNAIEERMALDEVRARPGIWLTAGLRTPTGRDHHAAQDPLLADVTGLPGPGLTLGAIAERTQHRTPLLATLHSELGPTQAVITGSVGIGRSFGSRLTVLGNVGHTFTAVYDGGVTDRTWVGGRVVVGRRLQWRGWGAARADVPIPGLGREQAQRIGISAGVALVR